MMTFQNITRFLPVVVFFLITLTQCSNAGNQNHRIRILVSTDIGGTDPDDFQSMIHLLMYADRFQIEGLISSPFGDGRKQALLDMIKLYEQDLGALKPHVPELPDPPFERHG